MPSQPMVGRRTVTPPPAPAAAPTPRKAANAGKQPASTGKAERFDSSDEVYHRLLHDDVFDAADFDLGYLDRFKGIMYMPMLKFRHTGDESSEIPWHRVYFYKYKGLIVWDRDQKINRIEEVRVALANGTAVARSAAIAAPAATAVAAVPVMSGAGVLSQPSTLTSAVPRPEKLQILLATGNAEATRAAHAEEVPAGLIVATFNILFDIFDAELLHTERRVPLICSALERCDADVIGLQEVTPGLFEALRTQSAALCAAYHWTALPKGVQSSQVILSRHPISEAVAQHMSNRKRCIYATIMVPSVTRGQRRGQTVAVPLTIANVHLISDYGDTTGQRRLGEISEVAKSLRPFPDSVILGDFNFGDEFKAPQSPHERDYVDCFLATRGTGPEVDTDGFTFNLEQNPLADLQAKHKRYSRRLDRILVRGNGTRLRPVACDLLGNVPTIIPVNELPRDDADNGAVPRKDFKLFPSDHFGVIARIAWEQSAVAGGAASAATAATATAATASASAAAATVAVLPVIDHVDRNFFPFHRAALCIVLPASFSPKCDLFRERFDKAYPRWMPHINLVWPFVHPEKFPDAAAVITAALRGAGLPRFAVRLRKLGSFPGRKVSFHIVPEATSALPDGRDPLQALFSALAPLFPACGSKRDTFHPHLTLGQCESGRAFSEVSAEFDRTWTPEEFTVSGVQLIAHLDDRPGYEVLQTIPLVGSDGGAAGAAVSASAGPVASGAAAARPVVANRVTPGAIPELVMEPTSAGCRPIPLYVPQDPLEIWMSTVTVPSFARDAPTHVSQKGAMYHIPSDLLDDYLARWGESVTLGNGDVPFLMEEVRGDPFRLYVDVDVKRTVEAPFDATPLVRLICTFAQSIFTRARRTGGAATVSAVSAAEDLGASIEATVGGEALCDATVLVTVCHTPWTDQKNTDAVFKSGFRMYFQRIFVTAEVYALFLRRLTRFLAAAGAGLLPPALPVGSSWLDVVDTGAVHWDRGRLFGTIKRRGAKQQSAKMRRIHTFHSIVCPAQRSEATPSVTTLGALAASFAADATPYSKEVRETEWTAHYGAALPRVLYGQVLRLWDVLPTDPGIRACDNVFSVDRLFSNLAGPRDENE